MKSKIFLLIALAFILRIIFIPQNAISFHYDMARDAYAAKEIWQDHNLKILGPPTSTPGLYHGVLYYYLLAIPYGLSGGNPLAAAIFLSLISSLTIIPIFILAREIFKDTRWAYLAGGLFAISFEATQYGPWLSNPNPAMLTVSLFFLGVWFWQKGKIWGLYSAAFAAALSAQFQFFLIYLFFLLPIFQYLFKIKTSGKQIFYSFLFAILGFINFIIATIKFNSFQNVVGGFFNISVSTQIDFRTKFTELALNYIDNFSNLFINNFLPTNIFLGGVLLFIVLYILRKNKFILFCLLSNFPIFIFGGHTNAYANVGLVTPAILGVIIFLQILWKKNLWFFITAVALFLFSNLFTIYKNAPLGQVTLVIPNGMVLKNQLALVDETYKVAVGQPFSINTLTLPLWTNTTWAYLYSWYGKNKYGYVPSFYGRDQVGQLGEKDLQKIEKPLDLSFFIIEPHDGIPVNFYNSEMDGENSRTQLVSETNFGLIKLQQRKVLDEKD